MAASECARFASYKATQLRLKTHGRATLLTESDDTWQGLRDRINRARRGRNPVLAILVLLGLALVVAEILSEFGVDSSNRCAPKRLLTMGMCASPSKFPPSSSKSTVAAYHARYVPWDDRELVDYPIYEGLRNQYNGQECFHSRSSAGSSNVIISNCSVSQPTLISPGRATLTFEIVKGEVYYIMLKRIEQREKGRATLEFIGTGGMTHTGNQTSAVISSRLKGTSAGHWIRMFEYFDSVDLTSSLLRFFQSNGFLGGTLQMENKSPLLVYTIRCEKVGDVASFASGVQVYRRVQLEETTAELRNMKVDGVGFKGYAPMNVSDVIRAGIAISSTNSQKCSGETFIYTNCGVYNVRYMFPLLGLLLVIFTFAIVKCVLVVRADANIPLPYTASAWSAMALENNIDFGEDFGNEGGDEENGVRKSQKGQISLLNGYYELHEHKEGCYAVSFSCMTPKKEGKDAS